VPLRYQIAGGRASEIVTNVENAIMLGQLKPGEPLPTVRHLAKSLRLSPATVNSAYRTLKLRGLLSAHGRQGTVVSRRPPLSTRASAPLPKGVRDLTLGNPDTALLPRLKETLADIDWGPRLYGEATNDPRLIELARKQFERDGIPGGSIAVANGALDAIERLLDAHLRPGDRVAVEDPGYSAVFDLLGARGLVAKAIAMDDFGPLPSDFEQTLHSGVEACIVTSRAQNPTGAALDGARASQLRTILRAHPGVFLIEDDHCGPVSGVPCQTLYDRNLQRWAVVRSVSKSLGPDLRLATIAADPLTIARVEGRQQLGPRWVSHLLQQIVVALWTAERTDHLLNRAAKSYAARREALLASLAAHGLEAHGRSGFNVWVPVPEELPVVQMMREAGWAVSGGERYRIRSRPAVRVTITTLRPFEARKVAADLAGCLRPQLHAHVV
jgi:DNA-binding transcriptional MocR family regulator